MNRLYSALPEALTASVFLIPYLLYCKKKHKTSALHTLLLTVFAVYLSTVYSIAGLPSVLYVRYQPNLNLTPFLYMFSDRTTSLLNVLLFIPLGFFVPVLWEKFRKIHRTVLYGFLISCCIEFLQIFTYRATDINDLITNTLGTLAGFIPGMVIQKTVPRHLSLSSSVSLHSILAAVFCTMFFLNPLLVWLLLRF